jgi:hypothetical protein
VAYEDIGGLKEEIQKVFCFIVLLVQVKLYLNLLQESKANFTSVLGGLNYLASGQVNSKKRI